MDEVRIVRYRVQVQGQSVRRVARELEISRNTAKRYLLGAAPEERKPTARVQPVRSVVRPRAEALLRESARWTTSKQRLTATRLHAMLRSEGLVVGLTSVRRIVREWKRQRQEVFVPLQYAPGELGQIDFFQVVVEVAGERQKAWMFVLRLMHSGRDFAWLYPRQDQVCFLDGHVRAFEHFGAVPHRLAYDNLRAAVARMLAGSERLLAARFEALVTHYLFEASFARPRTGHDKGGVEARGKGIRLQELVPIPVGDSLDAISAALCARLAARADEVRNADGRSIAERFADERERMLPLPARAFEPARTVPVRATRRSLVHVEGAQYSVWSTWAGLDVVAYVGVHRVAIAGPGGRVEHPRVRFGQRSVDYRHYVRELATKPQALRQVAGSLMRDLGEPFGTLWRGLVDERGPRQAARVMARVLAVIVERGIDAVSACVERALASGEHILFALSPPTPPRPPLLDVPAPLADIVVHAGAAADYDRLLGGDA